MDDDEIAFETDSERIVSLVPPQASPDWHCFALTVRWTGEDRYAVVRHQQAMAADGSWAWQTADNRSSEEWLAEHRFDLERALALAHQYAPEVRVNGITARQAYERWVADGRKDWRDG